MYVAFDTFPTAAPVKLDWSQQPVELPTMPGQLDAMEASIGRIIDKIDRVPIETIGTDLQKAAAELNATLLGARGAMTSAQSTLDNTNKLVEPNSVLTSDLSNTLQEVSQAARSIRVLTDYLARHPESLIRGKTGDSKQ